MLTLSSVLIQSKPLGFPSLPIMAASFATIIAALCPLSSLTVIYGFIPFILSQLDTESTFPLRVAATAEAAGVALPEGWVGTTAALKRKPC